MKPFPSTPQLAPSVSHLSENGLHLLVHPTQPQWLVLNKLGYEVASLCDGHHSAEQIATQIASSYKIEHPIACRHVEQYLYSLAEKGWLSSPLPLEPEISSGLDGC